MKFDKTFKNALFLLYIFNFIEAAWQRGTEIVNRSGNKTDILSCVSVAYKKKKKK